MKVLVHFDAYGNVAHGLWWVDPTTGDLENLYSDPSGPEAARGKVIVFGKTNKRVAWSDWFDTLTTRAPYSEDWVVYDSMGLPPDQFLKALRPPQPLAS